MSADGRGAGGSATVRGIRQIGDPRVWGTTVGAVGGTVFVLANRSDLAGSWPLIAVTVWALALIPYVWFVLVVRRELGEARPVGRAAGFVYLGSVVGMVVLIRAGSVVLDHADRPELRPALILAAVGLHFLPFASAFHAPLFKVLGSLMVGLGCAGLAIGWARNDHAAAWAAVVAGVVMILVIAAGAATSRKHPHAAASAAS